MGQEEPSTKFERSCLPWTRRRRGTAPSNSTWEQLGLLEILNHQPVGRLDAPGFGGRSHPATQYSDDREKPARAIGCRDARHHRQRHTPVVAV